jgi:hypothetical protein
VPSGIFPLESVFTSGGSMLGSSTDFHSVCKQPF